MNTATMTTTTMMTTIAGLYKRTQERAAGPTVTWHFSPTQRFGMWWQRWCSCQWGQSWFLQETSTWTLRERAEWRWQRWGLRTSPHTISRDGERGIDIRHRVRWWNKGGWWGSWRNIFCVLIVRSFKTWPSRTHDTTPAHYMVMVCLGFCLPEWSVILPMSLDTPTSLSIQTSDEDTYEQYFCAVWARCLKAKQNGGHHNSWISEYTLRIVYDRLHVTLAI